MDDLGESRSHGKEWYTYQYKFRSTEERCRLTRETWCFSSSNVTAVFDDGVEANYGGHARD